MSELRDRRTPRQRDGREILHGIDLAVPAVRSMS